ncbi:uncharacterized protein [Spinacia oleracea]|uniref:Uncharacterized protein isoform X1 n=1 Tax=Spinacia oleracea TaxID=3562 RepID=A0ABM3R5L2_SPIOL|nr:uncharacterized protein LOC110782815 isoform X1 [Spinacia oleracea]
MSTMTLSGLVWIVSNHRLVFGGYYDPTGASWFNILSLTVHSVIFLGLLYKYLEWSAFWNMSMVISFMDEQTGIEAFGMSDYYGKHCKKTGFQLMLGFFVFGNVLRLPCLYAGLCTGSVAGVLITCIVIMMVSLSNLVKWVAFLVYFQYCKQQTMEKKLDDQEQNKNVKFDAT